MKTNHRPTALILAIVLYVLSSACATQFQAATTDPLPSWHDGPSKQMIVKFVEEVTNRNGEHYVEPPERVAVFDNDGTLWAEQPIYTQFLFILDRIRSMAAAHPEWKTTQPFQAVLENDFETLGRVDRESLAGMMATAVSGMTTDEFTETVNDWMNTARHPLTGQPFSSMVYQPMLELLRYLESHGFSNYIVSGGGSGFIRPWSQEVYGIPPERVVGTSMVLEYALLDGKPVINRKPGVHFMNNNDGKPISIERHIGRRPILAVGNSDGDYQMLEWTTSGPGKRLGLIVHHTDTKREWAYDRHVSSGRLDRGINEADANGWLLIDMQSEWNTIFPFQ